MNELRPIRPGEAGDTDAEDEDHRRARRARRFWDWLSLALPNVSSTMFRQKMTHLAVQRMLEPAADGRPDRARIERRVAHLREKAEKPQFRGEWRLVNEIELVLIGLADLGGLRAEARRQTIEAERIALPCAADYAKQIENAWENESNLRDTLFRLVSELQDRHRKRYLLREFVAAYTARVSLVFGLATTLFMLVIFGLAWIAEAHLSAIYVTSPVEQGPPAPPEAPAGGMRAFASFYVALAAGLFGAAFSMMAQTRKRVENSTLEDMRTNARFAMLLFRLGVGLGAAMILYFVFDTGLLGDGALTPKLREAGFDVSIASTALFTSVGGLSPNRDLSLLMLWSFVAGFSEVMVPSILRRAEAGAEAK